MSKQTYNRDQSNIKALFHHQIDDDDDYKMIRSEEHRSGVLGRAGFKDEIEAVLAGRVWQGKGWAFQIETSIASRR